jgi:hypothetical protein
MAAANTNAQVAPRGALRVKLIVIAAIATLVAVAELPIAFEDFGHTEPLRVFAQRVTSAKLMIAPFIAGSALFFAAIGRVRAAIAMLAALMLVASVAVFPTYPILGLEQPVPSILIERVVFPLLGVAALVFAIHGTRLALATVFVTLPMILSAASVVLFAVVYMISGF